MTLGHVPELHTENHYKRAVAMLVDARILGHQLRLEAHRSSKRRINYRIWIMKPEEIKGPASGGMIYEQGEIVARFKSVPKEPSGPKHWTSFLTCDEAMDYLNAHRNRLKSPYNKRKRKK